MSWAMIVFLYAGPLALDNAVTTTTVPFTNQALCEAARPSMSTLTDRTKKEVRTVCVQIGGGTK